MKAFLTIKKDGRLTAAAAALLILTILFTGCVRGRPIEVVTSADESTEEASSEALTEEQTEQTKTTDYLILVNASHPVPKTWESTAELVTVKTGYGKSVTVERETLESFKKLQAELEKQGVGVDIESAYRSEKRQTELYSEYFGSYGADYTARYVAKPGLSEHQTGLAVDVCLIEDGQPAYYESGSETAETKYKALRESAAQFGFIVRYPAGKENITGYAYEPWHLRYVGAEAAKEIMSKGVTLEEYLGAYGENISSR